MKFGLSYSNSSRKFLKKSEKKLASRILDKLELLKENPVPSDTKRMKGYENPTFRIRVGKYRVLYEIKESENLIIIVKIDKRERVYD